MSNYLRNLAGRVVRKQPPILPRLPSHFEAASGVQGPFVVEAREIESRPHPETPDPISTIRPAQPAAGSSLFDQRSTSDEEVAKRRDPLSLRHDAQVNEVRREHPEERAATTEVQHQLEPKLGSTDAAAVPQRGSEKKVEAPAPRSSREATPERSHRVATEARPAQPRPSERRDEVKPSSPRHETHVERDAASSETSPVSATARNEVTSVPATVVRVTPRPAQEPAAPRAAQPETPNGLERSGDLPDITVTIGRVDVRAVFTEPAPTPRRPEPRSGPSMTLAEYLKRRERGQR